MARNGSGTHAIPNTHVANTTITAAALNQNNVDFSNEITNSLALDGQSTMTGPLKAASGTVTAPGITFGADPDSGFYRIGANNIGLALGGSKVVDFLTSGTAITGTLSSSGALTVSSGGLTVSAGGATITGNSTITGTLGVSGAATTAALTASGLVTASAGASVASGLTVSSGGATITGNSTITGSLSISSSIAVASGGITITTGGITVNGGGAAIVGASSFTSGTLAVGRTGDYDTTQTGTTMEGQRLTVVGTGEVLHLCRQNNGTSVVFYNNAGDASRGSISHPNDSSTAYNTSSAAKLKMDIQTIPDGLSVIEAMRPRFFNWRSDGSPDFGFIAEEFHAIDPRLSPDGKQIDYSRPMAFVVRAIQQLSERLDAAEAR